MKVTLVWIAALVVAVCFTSISWAQYAPQDFEEKSFSAQVHRAWLAERQAKQEQAAQGGIRVFDAQPATNEKAPETETPLRGIKVFSEPPSAPSGASGRKQEPQMAGIKVFETRPAETPKPVAGLKVFPGAVEPARVQKAEAAKPTPKRATTKTMPKASRKSVPKVTNDKGGDEGHESDKENPPQSERFQCPYAHMGCKGTVSPGDANCTTCSGTIVWSDGKLPLTPVASQPPPEQPKSSWWVENWKRAVVPSVIVLALLLFAGLARKRGWL